MNLLFNQSLYFVMADLFQFIDLDFRYVMMLIIVIGSYFLSRPIISFFVTLDSIRLLTYIISGLFVLFFLCFTFILMDIDHLLLMMIKITFQCLAIFGIGLGLIYSVIRLTKKT